ncbi:hypothetical protein E4T48_05761 [Aureobasidium sp. EXF-10727]|nr:hypothetical protein E4T48_05761 [Aureobasidium sp. EXF-10727]
MPTPNPSTPPFTLSRATTPQDFTSIVACEFRTFHETFIRDIFMGPDTASNQSRLAAYYHNILHTNTADIWIKVTERETGKIVAASNWRVHMGFVPEHEEEDLGWEWLEGDEVKLEKCREVMRDIADKRKMLFTEPYCQLHICFTDPDYQRRGIGSMMLQWGCDLADQLFLPSWVEASPTGNFLYRKHGYADVDVKKGGGMEGSLMKREAKVSSVEGGAD